jgi:hypothetical protein
LPPNGMRYACKMHVGETRREIYAYEMHAYKNTPVKCIL